MHNAVYSPAISQVEYHCVLLLANQITIKHNFTNINYIIAFKLQPNIGLRLSYAHDMHADLGKWYIRKE
jgi:hypothetical protein